MTSTAMTTPVMTTMPIGDLRYGHDPAAGEDISARVTNREEGLDGLAALLRAYGVVVPLIVVQRANKNFVLDGNRRLRVLRDILKIGTSTPVPVRIIDAPDGKAIETSLALGISALGLHPVDEFEGFATVVDKMAERENIARQDAVTKIARDFGRQRIDIERSLAIGALSPKIRKAWRDGTINADTAKAFTLGNDHKSQDALYDKLAKRKDLHDYNVRQELKAAGRDVLSNLKFIGVETYELAGGALTRDLFDDQHVVHNPEIAARIAGEKLAELCRDLRDAQGWAWAEPLTSLPAGAQYSWRKIAPEAKALPVETRRLKELNAIINGDVAATDEQVEAAEREAAKAHEAIENRVYTPKHRTQCGVAVAINDGEIELIRGLVKPSDAKAPAKTKTGGAQADDASTTQKTAAKVSATLAARLYKQRLTAIQRAVIAEGTGNASKLLAVLTKVVAGGIDPERPHSMSNTITRNLDALASAVHPKIMGACLLKAFAAADYFDSIPMPLCRKALDEMKCTAKIEKKAAAAKLGVEFAKKTKWLPVELRVAGYDGPGRKGK